MIVPIFVTTLTNLVIDCGVGEIILGGHGDGLLLDGGTIGDEEGHLWVDVVGLELSISIVWAVTLQLCGL